MDKIFISFKISFKIPLPDLISKSQISDLLCYVYFKYTKS